MGGGNVRLCRDGATQMLFGLFKLIKPGQHLAEMIVRSRMTGRQHQRPFQRAPRLLVPLQQMQDPTKRHQRFN